MELRFISLLCVVSEAVPVQNQAAAQKLLQKMSQAVPEDRRGRGHRFKGKGKEEDAQVFTLDEWEKRKAIGSKSAAESYAHDTSRDEELARQLQEQLDLEDMRVNPILCCDDASLSRFFTTPVWNVDFSVNMMFFRVGQMLSVVGRRAQMLNVYG